MQIKFIIKISISLLKYRTLDKVKHNKPTLHFNIDNYILYDYSHLEHNIFSRFVISQIYTFVFNDSQNLRVVGVLWMENGFWKRQLKVGETIERLFIFTVLVDPKPRHFLRQSIMVVNIFWKFYATFRKNQIPPLMYVCRDLRLSKWIKQATQSANNAPTKRPKHKHQYLETNR